jgi:hypothetical protein
MIFLLLSPYIGSQTLALERFIHTARCAISMLCRFSHLFTKKHASIPNIEMAYCTDTLCGDRVSVLILHIMVHLAFISTNHSDTLTFLKMSIQFLFPGWLQAVGSVGRKFIKRYESMTNLVITQGSHQCRVGTLQRSRSRAP